MSDPIIGVILYVLGGAAGACFYLPFKKVKNWAWESYWMVYCLGGLIIVPWALALIFSPNVFGVIKATSPEVLVRCCLFGAMWGLGGLTWGLMIRYLGVGLGLAIGCGLCAASGTLIPPIAKGELGGYFQTSTGIALLAGVAISLVGIIVIGAAGMSKEGELPEEQKKAAVAEFNFKKGLLVAIFSGLMSSGMSFGLNGGAVMESMATTLAPVTSNTWKGMPVLVVVLFGGFLVNATWCLFLNLKNKTTGDYLKGGVPIVPNAVFSLLAGTIWCSQFVFFKIADSLIGKYSFAGWSVLMSSAILFSTLLGIWLSEWKGVSGRTKGLLVAGLAILVLSLMVIGYGNYLSQAVAK
jgi:L-rhamnose-H+ transport protein